MAESSLHNISFPPKPAFAGEKLKKLRKDNEHTLRSLAEKITSEYHYRTTFQNLALIEAGESQPSAYLLIIFARLFGVEETFFYEGTQPEEIPRVSRPNTPGSEGA